MQQHQEKVASSFSHQAAVPWGVGRLLLVQHLNVGISRWQSLAWPSVPAAETNQVEIPDSVATCVLQSCLPRAHLDAHEFLHREKVSLQD